MVHGRMTHYLKEYLMSKPKVLYISQEITPYLPESPMASLGQKLPQSIQERGFEVRTFMPKYGCINERRNQLHEVIRLSGMNIIIDDTDHPLIIKVATLQPSRMQVYFIDNDDYFQYHAVTDLEIRQTPEDNDERIMFFTRGVIETVKKLRWEPAMVHCQGWISSLVPMYLKRMYADDPSFRASKVIYSLFNDRFEGTLDDRFIEKLNMDGLTAENLGELTAQTADFNGLSRLAIRYADAIAVASPDVDPALIEYAESLGKPILLYPGDEDYADAYAEFYNKVLAPQE